MTMACRLAHPEIGRACSDCQDDLSFEQAVEKYPKNCGLVADLFNSLRGAISLERHANWEYKERYMSRWLGGRGEKDFTPVATSAQDFFLLIHSTSTATDSYNKLLKKAHEQCQFHDGEYSNNTCSYSRAKKAMWARSDGREAEGSSENFRVCICNLPAFRRLTPTQPIVSTLTAHDTHGQLSKFP